MFNKSRLYKSENAFTCKELQPDQHFKACLPNVQVGRGLQVESNNIRSARLALACWTKKYLERCRSFL